MLKPKEINEVQFPKAMLGYNADEVDKFLDKVVADYAELCRENTDLKNRLDASEAQVNEYRRREDELRSAREKIYRMAQEVAAKSKAEAARTEQEAREQAERIVSSAKRDSEAQRRLYERLQLEVTRFKGKAIALFKSEIDQLNNLPDLAVDAKDELRIRADELSNEDALSSPFVEVYQEKIQSPAEIDFGIPDEEPEKPQVDLPPVDPAEDFAVGYLAEKETFSGALGLSVETVEEPTEETPVIAEEPIVEEVPVEEPVVEEPIEEPVVEEAPAEEPHVIEKPHMIDTPLIAVEEPGEEPSVGDQTQIFDIRPAVKPHETVSAEEIIGEFSEGGTEPPEGRIENGWYNETADFDMIDTDVMREEQKKEEEAPLSAGSKFTQLRFGTDYDITKDEGEDSSHSFFFKKKK